MNFTETAKWHSSKTPFFPAGNKGIDLKKLTVTKPKLFSASIGKAPAKSAWAIPKMDGPAPGSYETAAAIQKT